MHARFTILTIGLLYGFRLAVAVDFDRLVLSEAFFSEGAAIADIDADGHNDIVSGPWWYRGPEFRDAIPYASDGPWSIKGYSDYFFTFAHDFNGDGRLDILAIPIPGQAAHWYENPGKDTSTFWRKHLAFKSVGGESPDFEDLSGDGLPELVCVYEGAFGYAQPDPLDPYESWNFTPVTPNRKLGRFTHGMGIGDIDGDGRRDLIESSGWWKQPEQSGALFEFHATRFAQSGGAQILVYDFDGDGDNDVISSQNAHAWGLTWFERRGDGNDYLFVPHPILTDQAGSNPYGVAFSQMHALALADMDQDGVMDVVTGKRYFAHGGNDPGSHQMPVLYWFQTNRAGGSVEFVPHLIHERVGVGTQLTTGDINGDSFADIVVGNKLGTTVILSRRGSAPTRAAEPSRSMAAGGVAFAKHVRETEPLSPEDERRSFSLPEGFEVQLVAAEPDIDKPMNLAFDSRGRLWCSSSREYPHPVKDGGRPRDTIKVLEDTDGDGRADKITTFADGLNIPMGLYPYRDGVICFSIPNIWFLRDTDGDGRADRREVLYGPIGYERDTHGLCNAFTRGHDGWLYACHGFNNQTRVSGRDGHEISMQSGNTFRMRLDGSGVQHFTYGQVNPFGMAFDEYGDLFTADCHTKPVTLLLRGGYYQSFGKPHDGIGFVPDVMTHLHGSTAIGGIAIYSDDRFPAIYQNNAFGGNVMTSRINRNSLHRNGSSVQVREQPDFLISGDPWFRPVDLQIGPDGAMYVADFYNRIIGHYEVPLDHPGRDRTSGRIWRIVYTGSDQRRDVPPGLPAREPMLDATLLESCIAALESVSLARRQLASDAIADMHAAGAGPSLRRVLREGFPAAKVHALWLLHRIGEISQDDLAGAMSDSMPLVRSHALGVLAESDVSSDMTSTVEWIKAGLSDETPIVQRSAAMAATVHQHIEFIDPLLQRLRRISAQDVHLRHAVRMALRDHLQNEAWFVDKTHDLEPASIREVASICLALKNTKAAEYLVEHLQHVGDDPETLLKTVSTAARYLSVERSEDMVDVVKRHFGDDSAVQRELLEAIATGFDERGLEVPDVIKSWAVELARGLLERSARGPALSWTAIGYPNASSRSPWANSMRRKSADGMEKTLLYSSFPHGEKLTGIYRSDSFALPEQLSFYVAGHDGYPDQSLQGKNWVRLHDALSGKILHQAAPPRNDTAQRIEWHNDTSQNRRGYIEIVDGNTDGAFAWLAAGRFSVEGLNPNTSAVDQGHALGLIKRLRLDELRPQLVTLASNPNTSRGTLAEVAGALVALHPSAALSALAIVPAIRGADGQLVAKVIAVLIENRTDEINEALASMMRVASAPEQLTIAERLASDATGAATLLEMLEAGHGSRSLLNRPTVSERMSAVLDDGQRERIARLVQGLADDDEVVFREIVRRKQLYLNSTSNIQAGQKLFRQHCAACHQVAGRGKVVGPNLDGIGNRGLDRLAEDILAPSRNVDVAFRASTVLTDAGTVYTGLVKRTDGSQLILVDSKGKEHSISADSIEQRRDSHLSPMPANLVELVNEAELNDLLHYLLSLR